MTVLTVIVCLNISCSIHLNGKFLLGHINSKRTYLIHKYGRFKNGRLNNGRHKDGRLRCQTHQTLSLT